MSGSVEDTESWKSARDRIINLCWEEIVSLPHLRPIAELESALWAANYILD